VIASRAARSWLNCTVGGLPAVDATAAVILSAFAVGLTSGALHPSYQSPNLGIAASAGVLAMTAPVAWRRLMPLAMSGTLAAGAVANGLIFGPMVRCAGALPAVFLVAFAVGARLDRARSAAGLALCAVNVAAQCVYDPPLGASTMALMLPVLAGFFASGRLVRARTEAAELLRLRSADLRRQREQTARLAVKADRARVAGDLAATLHGRLGEIAAVAAAGRQALGGDPSAGQEALLAIEHGGREILHRMRAVVGALHEDVPAEPQPSLARLSDLLSRATTADARLAVEGSPRTLPAGLELSGFRIVEHLLVALEDAPGAPVDVSLRFGPDALELEVSGPPARHADVGAVLAAARERAALHGGTVDVRTDEQLRYATARLPLISASA
jgi:signal transduction histidine kinase